MTPAAKPRHTRYPGAIVRDDHSLLIQHRFHGRGRSDWLLPGGGREPGAAGRFDRRDAVKWGEAVRAGAHMHAPRTKMQMAPGDE